MIRYEWKVSMDDRSLQANKRDPEALISVPSMRIIPPLLRRLRSIVACTLALVVAVGVAMPSPHAHVIRTADGQAHVIVHQHWSPHRLIAASGPSLDDEDTATYLDNAAVLPYGAQIDHSAVTPTFRMIEPQALDARATLIAVSRPHAPPPRRSQSLRAPPRFA